MRLIEEECKLEAQRDAKILQQRIDEEIKETIGADEEQEPSPRIVEPDQPKQTPKELKEQREAALKQTYVAVQPMYSKKKQKKEEKKLLEQKLADERAKEKEAAKTAGEPKNTSKEKDRNNLEESFETKIAMKITGKDTTLN